jgi:hypothetical protein
VGLGCFYARGGRRDPDNIMWEPEGARRQRACAWGYLWAVVRLARLRGWVPGFWDVF